MADQKKGKYPEASNNSKQKSVIRLKRGKRGKARENTVKRGKTRVSKIGVSFAFDWSREW